MKRIFSVTLIILLLSLAAFASKTTLTGTITDSQGTGLNGTLVMTLPVPAQDSTTSTAVAPGPVLFNLQNGAISGGAQLYDVANLQPGGLYYQARAFDTSGNLQFYGNYIVTGATFNLGTATPTSVTTSNISYSGVGFTSLSNVWTGNNTFQGSSTFSGLALAKNLNQVRYADQFPGATADAKIIAAEADLPSTGGVVDARGFGCGNQTISAQVPVGTGVGANSKPVQLYVSPCTTFNITEADGQVTFPISDGSCVIAEGTGGNRAAPFGTFAVNSSANIKAVFGNAGFQEFFCLKGVMLIGASGSTVTKGLIYLNGIFINSFIRDVTTTACYAPSALAIESGVGGSSDMIFDNDNFDCQGHSTGPVVNMTAQGAQGFGPAMFIGGGIQHAGAGQPLLNIVGNGAGAPITGMTFWGTQFETITGSGANGIVLTDVTHSTFDSLVVTGPAFTDLFHMTESAGGNLHDIWIRNLSTAGQVWTNFVNVTAAGASPATVSGSPTNLLSYTYKGNVTWANTPIAFGTGTSTSNGSIINAGTSQAQPAITITGATVTDTAYCALNAAPVATWQTGIQLLPGVVTANTVTPWLSNPTAGNITPAAAVIRCTLVR